MCTHNCIHEFAKDIIVSSRCISNFTECTVWFTTGRGVGSGLAGCATIGSCSKFVRNFQARIAKMPLVFKQPFARLKVPFFCGSAERQGRVCSFTQASWDWLYLRRISTFAKKLPDSDRSENRVRLSTIPYLLDTPHILVFIAILYYSLPASLAKVFHERASYGIDAYKLWL